MKGNGYRSAALGLFGAAIFLFGVASQAAWAQIKFPQFAGPSNDQMELLAVRAMHPLAKKELDGRLDQMPTNIAWDSLDDDDGGPISMLMTIVSPQGMDEVKQNYLNGAAQQLASKGEPKIAAEAAEKKFAATIAWQLKREAAGHNEKLVLLLGQVRAQQGADQKMIDDVFGKLVEDDELCQDYAIVYLKDKIDDGIVKQLSGSEREWTKPDGSSSNVKTQLFHPDSVYLVDASLGQWTDPDGEEFHSVFSARLFHPRTETLLAGKVIRVDDQYYFHPTHGWISAEQDDALAKKYGNQKQSNLSPAFSAVLPIVHKYLNTQIEAHANQRSKNAQDTAIFADGATRALAKQQLLDRLDKMPADQAWRELSESSSHVGYLCIGLYPNGLADEHMKLARSAESRFRLQSMPKISTDVVVAAFAAEMAGRLQAVASATHRQPVLVTGEVDACDPQSEQFLYDSYGAMAQNATLQKSCTFVAVPPDKAASVLHDISGDAREWTCPDGSNVNQVNMRTFNCDDICVLQGSFVQDENMDSHSFSTTMSTSTKGKLLTNTLADSVLYYFHPTRGWISVAEENDLASKYVPSRDDTALPAQLTVTVAPAPQQPMPPPPPPPPQQQKKFNIGPLHF